ncbi:MAG: hypothetical protein DME93_13570 [Verrucomicrobia bacterium]|nr:MAG: hypothetical protein DME93_13570 [Verrucomicrobiota bacterium]
MHPLEQLRDDALREIEAASDEQALEATRIKYLGKSGSISAWGEQMKTLGKEERPVVGRLLNETRNAVAVAIEKRAEILRSKKKAWRWLALTYRCRESLCPAHTLGILGIAPVRSPSLDTPVIYRLSAARDIRSLKCSNSQFKFSVGWGFRSLTDRTLKMNGIVSMP